MALASGDKKPTPVSGPLPGAGALLRFGGGVRALEVPLYVVGRDLGRGLEPTA